MNLPTKIVVSLAIQPWRQPRWPSDLLGASPWPARLGLAVLCTALAACGQKGPLVHASPAAGQPMTGTPSPNTAAAPTTTPPNVAP